MKSPMLQYVRYIMVISGTLPLHLIRSRKLIYTIYQYLIQASLITFLIFMYGVIPNFNESTEMLPKIIMDFVIYTTVYIKGRVCTSKNMGILISNLITYEAKLMDIGNLKIVTKYKEIVKKSQVIQIFYIVTMYFCFVAFIFPHYGNYLKYSRGSEGQNNSTLNLKIYKTTPYKWWLPFDEDKHHLVNLSIQSYCALLATNYYCFIEIILIVLPLNVILRLRVLGVNLKSINNIEVDTAEKINVIKKLVIRYIEEHIDIISNCAFLNATVKHVMLLEFLLTSLQLALALFQIISANDSTAIIFSAVYLFQTLVQLLILYWHADQIRKESMAIAKVVYELRWYEYNTSINTNIRIMMMRSQKPLSLTVGPFGDMTLEMFVKIIKAVYTYITFMQQTYAEN